MNKCLVIGSGAWGTAIAQVLAKNKIPTYLWARDHKVSREINFNHTNQKYFPKKKLNSKLKSISGSIPVSNFKFVFYVLPANAFEVFCKEYLQDAKIQNFIICSKGLTESGHYLSQQAKLLLNIKNLYFFSGPSFADEVIQGKPTAVSICGNKELTKVGSLFVHSNIRIYYSSNIQTIEFLGVIKNIYAIGAGIIDGLDLGYNARASYITRCIHEIQFALKVYKYNSNQILSMAGIGDLILTCSSNKSRNYNFGFKLIQNKNTTKTKQTIEGYNSSINFQKNSKLSYKQMPILKSIIKIINGSAANKEIKKLLERKFKFE